MKITKLHFNYHEYGTKDDQWGENYEIAEVGVAGCVAITEYAPEFDGDRWCFDISFEDDSKQRVFNPNRVFYEKED